MTEIKRPKVGVGILVIQDGKLLLGERIYSYGSGTWSPPGGHLEFGETPHECVVRELQEETGLVAEEIHIGPWTNNIDKKEKQQFVSLFMIVKKFRGVLANPEPEKCARWEWFDIHALPQPLFPSVISLLKKTSLSDL